MRSTTRAALLPLTLLLLLLAIAGGCGGDGGQQDQQQQTLTPPWAGPGTRPATQPATQVAAATQEAPPDRLYGTWVAQNVEAPIGKVDIHLTFRQEGPVRILAWSDVPLVGQVRSKTGPYQVKDHTIVSQAIRGGTSVKYWFTPDGQLVIQYADGKTVVFHKQQ